MRRYTIHVDLLDSEITDPDRTNWLVNQVFHRLTADDPEINDLDLQGSVWAVNHDGDKPHVEVNPKTVSESPAGAFRLIGRYHLDGYDIDRFHHVKRGSDYVMFGTLIIQSDHPVGDNDVLMLYTPDDPSPGHTLYFARPLDEVYDRARFTPIDDQQETPE